MRKKEGLAAAGNWEAAGWKEQRRRRKRRDSQQQEIGKQQVGRSKEGGEKGGTRSSRKLGSSRLEGPKKEEKKQGSNGTVIKWYSDKMVQWVIMGHLSVLVARFPVSGARGCVFAPKGRWGCKVAWIHAYCNIEDLLLPCCSTNEAASEAMSPAPLSAPPPAQR